MVQGSLPNRQLGANKQEMPEQLLQSLRSVAASHLIYNEILQQRTCDVNMMALYYCVRCQPACSQLICKPSTPVASIYAPYAKGAWCD